MTRKIPGFKASIRRMDALLAHYASRPALLDALNALVILDGCAALGDGGPQTAGAESPTLTSLALAHLRAERGRARPVPALTLEEMFDRKLDTYRPEQTRGAATMRRAKKVFCRALGGGTPLAGVTPGMVRRVLAKCGSAVTRNHLLLNFKTAANLARKQRLAAASPAAGIAPERVEWKEPAFFAPDRVERIMRIAEAHPGALDSGIGAFLALGFFAGVRTAEILRARWEDLDLAGGVLRIPKPKGWTRGTKPRLVELEPNAVAWLSSWRDWTAKHGRSPAGRIVRDAHDIQRWKALRLAPEGLSWGGEAGNGGRKPPSPRKLRATGEATSRSPSAGESGRRSNIPRHTYATMHVAAFRDAAATALDLGHSGGIRLLEKHYRGLVSQAVAEPYWRIMPSCEPAPPEPRPGRGHRTDLARKPPPA